MICCRSYQDIPDDPRDLNYGPEHVEEEDETAEIREKLSVLEDDK